MSCEAGSGILPREDGAWSSCCQGGWREADGLRRPMLSVMLKVRQGGAQNSLWVSCLAGGESVPWKRKQRRSMLGVAEWGNYGKC